MQNASEVPTTANLILSLEGDALDRCGKGDPGGFLDVYAAGISYFDPGTAARIDGHQAMIEYYRPWTGTIRITRYEMLHPEVVVDGNLALLTYNLVNYIQDVHGVESVGSQWNSTAVYQRRDNTWKSIHAHWSFTRHPAFRNMTPQGTEGL